MDNHAIIPSFMNTVFDETIDVSTDMAELGIDSILTVTDGLAKEIPLASLFVAVGKTAYKVRERNLLKQTWSFIKELRNGKVDSDKFSKYKEELESDPQKAEKELGRVLIILDRIIETEQSKILSRLYRNYINGNIDWDTFCSMSEITRSLIVSDIPIMVRIVKNNSKGSCLSEKQLGNLASLKRLLAFGLIFDFQNEPPWQITKEYPDRTAYKMSGYGQMFYDNGLV